MGKRENTRSGKGWITSAALLSILLLWLLVTGWRIHLYDSKIQGLEKQLQSATVLKAQATQRKTRALLCASTASELEGWKKSSPFASDFTKELANLPEGLLVHGFLLERQFSMAPLPGELAGSGIPLPVNALCISDHVALEICEAEQGSGVRSFPRFLSRMSRKFGQSLEYDRGALDSRWSEPGSRIEGKSAWSLSAEIPSPPLWNNVLEQP